LGGDIRLDASPDKMLHPESSSAAVTVSASSLFVSLSLLPAKNRQKNMPVKPARK
jgi:hypothetical protein